LNPELDKNHFGRTPSIHNTSTNTVGSIKTQGDDVQKNTSKGNTTSNK